jgi:hypothetical protein
MKSKREKIGGWNVKKITQKLKVHFNYEAKEIKTSELLRKSVQVHSDETSKYEDYPDGRISRTFTSVLRFRTLPGVSISHPRSHLSDCHHTDTPFWVTSSLQVPTFWRLFSFRFVLFLLKPWVVWFWNSSNFEKVVLRRVSSKPHSIEIRLTK